MVNVFSNGQLITAIAILVDALFGVLLALGVIQSKPDQATTLAIVTLSFNIASYVLAYVQHQQHVVKLQLASEEKRVAMQVGGVKAA